MALFGKLQDVKKQIIINDSFNMAFKYLEETFQSGSDINKRILSLDIDQYEKVELSGEIFAIEQSYNTKLREDCFFESHIKYIDMQLILKGEEIIEIANIEDLQQSSLYDQENDYSKYDTNIESSKILLKEGDVAILFPDDGHMPAIRNKGSFEQIFKTVVKLPISPICY